MDSETKAKYDGQSQELRIELKTWEGNWVKAHGKKPGKEDIKQNPDIAQKYKQYNKLRDILAGKIPSESRYEERKRKPATFDLPPQTPSKRSKITHTPRKSYAQIPPADLPGPAAEITTPSISRTLFSPALPTSIGPTPQKDGRVLGLFDLLGQTPSRSTGGAAGISTPNPVAATPSRRKGGATHHTPTTKSGRRIEPAGLATPLHERQGTANASSRVRTPSSGRSGVSKLQFATPAFLRRTAAPLPPVDENGEWKVGPLRLPKKPLVRSLSNMVAGLRKMEDEALEDEMDVLREMEMEEQGGSAGNLKAKAPAAPPPPAECSQNAAAEVEVGDSQIRPQADVNPWAREEKEKPVLLGGFDDENLYDTEEEEQLDRGRPLRVFKKKGQKRTTRRSNMKPTRAKRPSALAGDEGDSGGDDEVVPETQFDTAKLAAGNNDRADDLIDGLTGSDFDGESSDAGSDDNEGAKKGKGRKLATKANPAPKGKKADGAAEKEEGVVKKAVRKVKATAHANFKRLKLRGKGPKGGPGFNSRFRRKR